MTLLKILGCNVWEDVSILVREATDDGLRITCSSTPNYAKTIGLVYGMTDPEDSQAF